MHHLELISTFSYQPPSATSMTESTAPDLYLDADDSFEGIADTAPPLHAQIQQQTSNTCQQCNKQSRNKTALDTHARQTQHSPYACICGVTFSRFDVLARHLDKFDPKTFYPCPYCSRFTGSKAFPRQDHLTQHLQNYHNIDVFDTAQNPRPLSTATKSRKTIQTCPHEDCTYHLAISAVTSQNPQQSLFQTQKEFTKHLRTVHNESPFPCTIAGCERIGGKGFFRGRDLLKHQTEHNMTTI
jgi:hypothetical protein